MTLAVLNAGGRDRELHFPNAAEKPDDRIHAPVNYHAYAACTNGAFFRTTENIPREISAVLILLRGNLKSALAAIRTLKSQGKIIAISWKESGQHQIAQQLNDKATLKRFHEACSLAHGALGSTPESVGLYRAAGSPKSDFIPTPYPIREPLWDFSQPLEKRSGIFIGTREWDTPSRNHAAALIQACRLGVPVTTFNLDGRTGRKKLAALACGQLRIIEGPLPYTAYLREMAKCRVVFQRDASAVPGQVAGDALLCRMPCIGGNSAIEQLVFSNATPLESLLHEDAAWHRSVADSQARALEMLSYQAVARQLGDFFLRLQS